jgi:exosortase B
MNTLAQSELYMLKVKKAYAHFTKNSGLWLMFAGLFILFLPTLWDLFAVNGIWLDDEHAHGPIILAISLWLLWKRWQEIPSFEGFKASPAIAWLLFFVAASLYIPGRALDIIYFEVGAFILLLIGVVFMAGGIALFKKLMFPLLFMLFMVPLPNSLVGPLANFMKEAVSAVTVNILSWAGFQAGRTGVVIYLEQYQLLVADACAGMRTLFMLEALGILYLNLVHHSSMLRNIVLPILIIPISFTANVIRVIALALITYYWGVAAGQGFMHGFAGMVLFLAGLILMLATDSMLRAISRRFYGE